MKPKARVLRGILLGLIVFEGFYIAGTAFILNNGWLLAKVNTHPDSLKVEYRFGYSLLPGRLRLEGLNFRLQDHNIQFYFQMSRVFVSIDLVSLFSRQFHTTQVLGEELTFHFRSKKTAKVLETLDPSALPTIPGLMTFQKTTDSHPGPPENSWKIRLDGIDILRLADVWFDEIRFQGSATVRGGFFLNPGREVRVDTSHIAVERGNVTVGSLPALENLRGELKASLKAFHPGEIPDIEILKRGTADARFHAEVKTLAFLDYYLAQLPWLRFEEGAGALSLNAQIQDGRLLDNSQLVIQSNPLAVRFWNQRARGTGTVEWNATTEGSTLKIAFNQYGLFRQGRPEYSLRGNHLQLTASSDTRDLVDSLKRLDVVVAIPEAEVTDLRYWNSYLPKRSQLLFYGGRGKLSAKIFSFSRKVHSDEGWLKLSAENAMIHYGKMRIKGNLKVNASMKKSDITRGELWVPLSAIELREVTSTDEGVTSGPQRWWADIKLINSTLSLQEAPKIQTQLQITSLDGFPFLAFLSQASGGSVPSWIPSMLKFPHLRLSLNAEAGENRLAIDNLYAVGDHTRLVGWIKDEGESPQGRLLLEYGPLAAGLSFEKQGTRLRLEDAVAWYHKAEQKRHMRVENN